MVKCKGKHVPAERNINNYIEQRVISIADHVIKTKTTIRKTAKVFGVSKSTVEKYLSERLPKIDGIRYTEVRSILDKNKAEKHIRGGIATKRKYEMSV